MGISAIDDKLTIESSPTPSGFTEMDVFMGNSWLSSDIAKNHMTSENLSKIKDKSATSNRISNDTNMMPELNNKNCTSHIVEPGECVTENGIRFLGKKSNAQNLVSIDRERNHESPGEKRTETVCTNNQYTDYVPNRRITANNSDLSSDHSLLK
ncbi:hypothetical protein PV328_004037 [Microctonus aethiopoides]|uniref:Uncharacterized protein n=1 Tax=Microctonus aethiopoides TaxID=144406 RepID=A0AA39F9N3_9HYME|nr:hypothetical protein PV328_004037 [Microctonus aethiopoides]